MTRPTAALALAATAAVIVGWAELIVACTDGDRLPSALCGDRTLQPVAYLALLAAAAASITLPPRGRRILVLLVSCVVVPFVLGFVRIGGR